MMITADYQERSHDSGVDDDGFGSEFGAESDEHVSTELGKDDEQGKVTKSLAADETRAVRRLKVVFALVIISCTLFVGAGVYLYTAGAEQRSFEQAFAADANKVLEAIGNSFDKTLNSIDAYAVSLLSNARTQNQTWPWVNFHDFAIRTAKVLSLSDSVSIGVFPLVTSETRSEWEAFSVENDQWVEKSMQMQETDPNYHGPIFYNFTIKREIHHDFFDIPDNVTRPMLPTWQSYPSIPRWPAYNWDLMTVPYRDCIEVAMERKEAVMTYANNVITGELTEFDIEEIEAWSDYYSDYVAPGDDPSEPMSDLLYPLVDDLDAVLLDPDSAGQSSIVGMLDFIIYWRDLMKDILQDGSNGIMAVFTNPCAPSFTYQIEGPRVMYMNRYDHDSKYDSMKVSGELARLNDFSVRRSTYSGLKLNEDFCPTTINVYPSATFESRYLSSGPIIYTICAVLIFVLTSAAFLLYDFMVERRQKIVMQTALRSTAIVSSLFPSNVREQLEVDATESESHFSSRTNKRRLQSFLSDDHDGKKAVGKGAPIAELFPDTTVLFADIAGFTAWSSVRCPIEVFTLLETLYGAFDKIAERRGVFKVETIGDCYVAVVGLPKPRKHHALIMARFADDCRQEMTRLTRELEATLGPDTCELSLRLGLNSGPTTAGVLRGQKARFQLFGDTVNTAARMESTGERNRIHCSQKTADLIVAAGKSRWLTKRSELVEAKGKGKMQTYWVDPRAYAGSNASGNDDSGYSETDYDDVQETMVVCDELSAKLNRYVSWNLDVFEGVLRSVKHTRRVKKVTASFDARNFHFDMAPIEEVTEMVILPEFDAKKHKDDFVDPLNANELSQLRDYLSVIARMYRPNPFHNFEHASHVVMATKKLLARVVNPDCASAAQAHSSTYGITSDPLIQFAILFAALVHDVDHCGVPNFQLMKENPTMAARYMNKSVAEQNSVDIAWDLLMQECFIDLQRAIFADENELRRFRQLVVNAVLATDIFDKDLKAHRESRWKIAFTESSTDKDSSEVSNRKATIVLEHIIQAADVSHCMQHWKVYQRWNRCLFEEMYTAFLDGRSEKDPTEGWGKGELWFFDFYIIPLAKKLKECGVFGVSCDEFLDYAKDNRDEVAAKGNQIAEAWSEELRTRKERILL